MGRRKKPLPHIEHIIDVLRHDLKVRIFKIDEINKAVAWAEKGCIAVHENYHSRKKRSYHVISRDRKELLRFCREIGLTEESLKASEHFKFWHLTWFPEESHIS